MATVTGMTAARMEAIEAASVVDGTVNGSGHLILEKFSGATIDAGSVIGPTGAPGVTTGEMDDLLPVGMIIDYIGTTNPSSKWIKMEGQTVVNAQTLYAALWAKIPTSMKSGSSMLMPDTRGKVIAGYHSGDSDFNAIGKTGGAKTHTLITAEMPSHTHIQVAHTHIQNPHTHVQNAHTHPQNAHAHGVNIVSSTQDFTHTHVPEVSTSKAFVTVEPGGVFAPATVAGAYNLGSQIETSTETGNHQHNVVGSTADVAAENVAYTATNQNATATNQNATATNNYTGGDTAHNIMQPYITFMKILKVL